MLKSYDAFEYGKKYVGVGDNCLVRMYPHDYAGKPSWAVTLMRCGITFFRPAVKGNATHMLTREGLAVSNMEWWEGTSEVDDEKIVKYAGLLLTKGALIYFADASWAGQIKIGYTANLAVRYQTFLVEHPMPVKILAVLPGGPELESALHARFARLRTHNQWFQDCPDLREYIATL